MINVVRRDCEILKDGGINTNIGRVSGENIGIVWNVDNKPPKMFEKFLKGQKPTTKFVVAFNLKGGIYREFEECDDLCDWCAVDIIFDDGL